MFLADKKIVFIDFLAIKDACYESMKTLIFATSPLLLNNASKNLQKCVAAG
jgi:hypothetical protein